MSVPPRVRLAQRQISRTLRQRRGRVVLRNVTRSTGPAPAVNPPALADVVADGVQAAGSGALSLRGSLLRGRFILGDVVVIGTDALAVAAPGATDDGQHRITLPLTAPLTAEIPDATPVASFLWAADRVVPAEVTPYPRHLIDGQMILSGDLQVLISAAGLTNPPEPQSVVLFGMNGEAAKPYIVQSALPRIEQGFAVAYLMQVRCG